MSFVEQESTKGISLKFPPMASVPSTDKSNLAETPVATITKHVPVQNAVAPIMYAVPVSNIAVNQEQAEITQIASEPFSATPIKNDTNGKYKDTLSQMQGNVTVVLSTPQSFFEHCCPSSSRDYS